MNRKQNIQQNRCACNPDLMIFPGFSDKNIQFLFTAMRGRFPKSTRRQNILHCLKRGLPANHAFTK